MGRHWPFDCKAASKEGTVTLHSFLPRGKKPVEKALKSSNECEKFPFSLDGGWLLHKLVVFPFVLPTAISLLLTKQRNQDYYAYCCPRSFFHTVGNQARSSSLSLNAEFVCQGLGGMMLHWTHSTAISHCTKPVHSGRAFELQPFEIKGLFPLYREGFFSNSSIMDH